ncbi:MAG: signal peptidase I, partial [Methanobacteriota archaeon]
MTRKKNRLLKEAWEWGPSIIIFILFLFFFWIRPDILFETETPLVTVVSGSMEPTLHRGDILLLVGVDKHELKVGDIVVFSRPHTKLPIVHRVVETCYHKGETYLVTWGDANHNPDPGWEQTEKKVLVTTTYAESWVNQNGEWMPSSAVIGKAVV